jgi:uncharacterized protein (TIGR03437 family)
LGGLNGLALDAAGNFYTVDRDNRLIVKVAANGILTIVAGNGLGNYSGDGGRATDAALGSPWGVTVDLSGNIFVADRFSHRIRRVDAKGVISTIAGTGSAGFFGDGGPALNAQFNFGATQTIGMAADSQGNLYVADVFNHRIRRIDAQGMITTVAGNGNAGFSGDGGPAQSAALNRPHSVAVDGAGNLYIADTNNNRIRKVSTSGTITTIAGGGAAIPGNGGPAILASLGSTRGVSVDREGNIYFADVGRVRKVDTNGILTAVAGNGNSGFSGDGGPATSGQVNNPMGTALDQAGNLVFADTQNLRLRRVTPAGIISTVAGNGRYKFAGDGGPGTSASLFQPYSLALDPAGRVVVADTLNRRVRVLATNGEISTLAGTGALGRSGDGGPAVQATLDYAAGVAADATGVVIADSGNERIRKVSPSGTISLLAGDFEGFAGDGGPAINAKLDLIPNIGSLVNVVGLADVALDTSGNLFVADSGNHRIRKITPSGIITTVAGNGTPGFSGDGGPATSASLNAPRGLAVDAAGNIYIGDEQNHRVRRVSPGGTITTVAGNGAASFSGDGGPATAASLNQPGGLAVDSAGNLFIADRSNGRIRRVSAGVIATVAGGGTGFDGVTATAARVSPSDVAVDVAGNLYIADVFNDRIRKILANPPTFSVGPAALSFTAAAGAAVVPAQQIAVGGPVNGLAWSAQVLPVEARAWLSLSAASGRVPAVFSASVNVADLLPGTYNATISVQAALASPSTQSVNVMLTVTAGRNPELAVEPASLVIEVPQGSGDPPAQTLRVSNRGPGGLSWTARGTAYGGGAWLGVQSTTGSASGRSPSRIPVRVSVAGLQPGVYSGEVNVDSAATGQATSVPVTVLLYQIPKVILTTQRGLRFTVIEGGPGVTQTFGVINAGQSTMDWSVRAETVSGGNWLTVATASGNTGSSTAGSSDIPLVTVLVNPQGLAAGTYSGLVRVESPGANNTPYLVTVEVEVLPADRAVGPQVSPPQLIFTANAGGSSPGSQTLRLTSSQATAVEAQGGVLTLEGGSWLTVQPTNLVVSASDPRNIIVQPELGALGPGTYRAAITFQFADKSPSQAVEVFFLVAPAAVADKSSAVRFACAPSRLVAVDRSLGRNFGVTAGSPANIEVQVVDDCGSAVNTASVTATFSTGEAPLALSGVGGGLYTATWRPAAAAAQVAVTLNVGMPPLPAVELQASGQVRANPKAIAVYPGGVVNAASFAPGVALAPGGIISVFGQNLAAMTEVATDVPLPTRLAGATLTVGGVDAPLFFAASGQINAQLPFELPPASKQQAVVRTATGITVPESLIVAPARPGIFTTSQSGKGQGVIFSAQGALVDSASPAAAGDVVVVYCTGLGLTTPPVATGRATPGAPLSHASVRVDAQIGGLPAVVHYAGLTPGFVGLYQVNVQIPAGVPAGSTTTLVLMQEGVPSNTVTLAVK